MHGKNQSVTKMSSGPLVPLCVGGYQRQLHAAPRLVLHLHPSSVSSHAYNAYITDLHYSLKTDSAILLFSANNFFTNHTGNGNSNFLILLLSLQPPSLHIPFLPLLPPWNRYSYPWESEPISVLNLISSCLQRKLAPR